MRVKILTIGGAVQDIIFQAPQAIIINNNGDVFRNKLLAFEYGAKIKIDQAVFQGGGGANNLAVGLTKLGFKASPLVAVGQDEVGQAFIRAWRKLRISTSKVQIFKELATDFSVVIVGGKRNDHTVFSYRGVSEKLDIRDKDLAGFDWLYLTSLSGENREKNLSTIHSFLTNQPKIRLVFNPGQTDLSVNFRLSRRLIKISSILCLNRDEAQELASQISGQKIAMDYHDLFKTIFLVGSKLVVITDGEHGARAYDGKNFYFARAKEVKKVVDTTGAGDAFGAAFLASLIIDPSRISLALKRGIRNGSLVIKKFGAQIGLGNKKQIF